MTCNFTAFSKVFQLYQGQLEGDNEIVTGKFSPPVELETRFARCIDQRLIN